jgi:hypothetical protein
MATAAPQENIDVGRVIGRGFEALKANFLPFFAGSLLLAGGPNFLLQYWTMSMQVPATEAEMASVVLAPLAGWLLTIVGGSMVQGLLVRSTVLYLSGRPADMANSVTLALRLLLPIIGVSIAVGVLFLIGLLFLVVPGIMIYCAFIVAVPALVEERRGVFGSMQRSRDLTRGSRMRIFLLLVVAWMFAIVITALINQIAGVSLFDPSALASADRLLAGIAAGLGNTLTTLIFAVLTAALYMELRTVKEGATSDDLAAIFE